MKLETDKIIFAIGGIILGFGVVNILHTALGARSYAASPSDFSDLLANSPPPRRLSCPPGQIYNAVGKCIYPPMKAAPGAPCVKGQVLRGGRCVTAAAAKPANIAKAVNDLLGIPSIKTKKPRHETNNNNSTNNNPSNNNTSSAPTGGGGGRQDNGKTFKEIRCQTGCNKQCGKGGCPGNKSPRLQFGVYNDSPEVDFNVTVKIPETWTGVDTATLQVGGVAHHNGCSTDGYKAYVGINGGDNGIGTETGVKKTYTNLGAKCNNSVGNLRPGQTYQLRALKRNVGSSVQVNTWVNGQPHCSVTHANGILGRKFISSSCPAVDQLRVDGWPDTDTSNAISVSSGPP